MNLDEAQKRKVADWLAQGETLSQIQSRLAAEFGLRLTYMELRFLLDDLKLKPQDKPAPPSSLLNLKPDPPSRGGPPGASRAAPPSQQSTLAGASAPPAGGRVTVSVDQVTRPGSLVSGRVTFSDGKSAEWYLDQFGRLGVVPQTPGYKPSQADLATFQNELQNELAKLGM